jgi:hypothetical protein
MSRFNFFIDLPVRSEWQNVDLLRISVQNCFVAVFANVEGCHAIAMVTGELVENAVKYGYWSGDEKSFRLRVVGEEGRAVITVENPVKPGDAGVEELLATIRWIDRFPSAADAYRERLRSIAAAGPSARTSRLGLVRVAYEGACMLRAELTGNSVAVSAAMEFQDWELR